MSKRIVSLALAVVMLTAVLATSVFAAYKVSGLTKTLTKTHEVAQGVTYKEYAVTSGKLNSSGQGSTQTFDANMLTFGTADYLPMVYSSWSGGSGNLLSQYNKAVKEGYDVVGVINGSFFSMGEPYGTLVGINISDGKVTSAHAGCSDSVVAFGSDGSLKVVNSALSYSLYINGTLVPDGLGYVNKRGGNGTWYNTFYYYDQSCGPIDSAKTDTVAANPGYEILCDKLDGTELTVGGTLKGKVVEIRKNSYASSLGRNQFVLYCKTASPYAAYLQDLQVGDPIEISVDETVEASKEVMRNAASVISNVGWLVKDGVDQTELVSTIGTHSVEYCACWTAFGIKPNGEYVFLVSEGTASTPNVTSLTMKDVAKLLIAEGCTNVIRMDGGGSSAMYLKNAGSGSAGYAFNQGRAVGDCIMIVKRSSMQSEAKKTALQNAITAAEQLLTTIENTSLQNAVNTAKAVLANTASVNSDYIQTLAELLSVKDGIEELTKLIAQYEAADRKEYSKYARGLLDAAYNAGKAVLSDKNAVADDYNAAVKELRNALALKGTVKENVALGKKYTYSITPNASYPDTGMTELTDGQLGSSGNAQHPSWVGLNGADFNIVLDLGEKRSNIDKFNLNFIALASWGICAPESVKISVSDDGKTYTEVGTIPHSADYQAEGKICDYILDGVDVSGRYIKFDITRGGAFVFISEIQVEVAHAPVETVPGDVNDDGEIDSLDYIMVKRSCLNLITLSEPQRAAADVDGDGEVTPFDYVLIKRMAMGII